MGKINLISSVFKGSKSEPDPETRLIKGLVTERNCCFCLGGDRVQHTWEHPKCIYFQPKPNPQPQQLQLLPPPKENYVPGDIPLNESAGSLFEKQGENKSCFNFTTGNKVTRDMEMLVQAYNKAVKENPIDYLTMTDTDCMTLTFAYHVTKELNAMGYWIEESPFE